MQMLEINERQVLQSEMELLILQSAPGFGPLIYTWIGRHATRVDANSAPYLYAANVLNYCERYGWIEDPALLVTLLEKVAPKATGQYAAQLPSVAARLRKQKPDETAFFRNSTAWETCHLSVKLPFINRDITRIAIQQFFNPLVNVATNEAVRALIVNGPLGSGKTFTGDFLRLLIRLLPGQNGVAEADFLALAGDTVTPDRLAIYLAEQMGVDEQRAAADMRRLRATRPERWAKDIAIWLAAEAHSTGKTWHIFLDNCQRPGVPEATYTFIDLLLAALEDQALIAWDIHDPIMGVPLRLVLTDYTRNPPENNRMLRVEDIKPVTVENLKQHFLRYFVYKEWPVDNNEIDAIAERYRSKLPDLFPAAVATPGSNGNPITPRWKLRELADVVLLDCEDLERRRASAAAGGSAPVSDAGNGPGGDE